MVRKNGEEWLITMNDTEAHIPQVYEEVKREIVIVNHWNKIRLDWTYLFIMNHENCFPRHKNSHKNTDNKKQSYGMFLV